MCMRPTHITSSPAEQLVGVHESHDDDFLPIIYHEVIDNTVEQDLRYVVEKAYFEDEKPADNDDDWFFPDFEKAEMNDHEVTNRTAVRSFNRVKKYAKYAVLFYSFCLLVVLFVKYGLGACSM